MTSTFNMSWRGLFLIFAFVALVSGVSWSRSGETAQQGATLDLDPSIECWYHDGFPQLSALMTPSGQTAKSRLYFRCADYPDYYFVDLDARADGSFLGVAPQAEETCGSVVYYVESLGFDFASSRTPEKTVPVTSHDQCRRRFPLAALFEGDPDIYIGTTSLSANQMAPGFRLLGVRGFISAATGQVAGASAAGGGGVSPAVWGGIAAAGGAGALVVATGGESAAPAPDAPPAPVAPPPAAGGSTTTTTAPPGAQAATACFETNPSAASIRAGETIELDARCSQGENIRADWDLGDGRTRENIFFIRPVYRDPGTYDVTLTLSDTTTGFRQGGQSFDVLDTFTKTITVRTAPVTACFAISGNDISDSICSVDLDASCSTGEIVAYDWNAFGLNQMDTFTNSGKTVSWNLAFGCQYPQNPGPYDITLTVTAENGDRATETKRVLVEHLSSPQLRATEIPSSITAFLSVAPFDGSSRARVRIGEDRTETIDSSAPRQYRYGGKFGTNRVELIVSEGLDRPGFVSFEFDQSPGFVAGSIRAETGQVLSVEGRRVVFRLSGASGERVAFSYKLLP